MYPEVVYRYLVACVEYVFYVEVVPARALVERCLNPLGSSFVDGDVSMGLGLLGGIR